MKRSILLCATVLAIGGCAAQQPPPAAADGNFNHADQLRGRNMSAGETLRGSHENPSCPDYNNNAPTLTIANGLGQLDFSTLRFQGHVTPQGVLVMRTGAGQRFEGQINSQNVLTARVIGGCVYDATWRKSA